MTSFIREHRRFVGGFMAALLISWQIGQPVRGATIYWDGSTDGNWGTNANWNANADGSGAAAGVAVGTGNDLVFVVSAGAQNFTQTLGANRTVRSLTFNSSLQSALAISGSALTITPTGTGLTPTGTGVDMTNAAANVSIASTITLGADQTWLLGTGRTLTVTGAFSADATDDLIVSGAGTLQLGNTTDNSYSIGSVTLQNGATLVNTQDNAFGDTTTTIIMNAGTTWDKGGFGDSFRGLSGTGTIINAGNLDFRSVTGDVFTFFGTASGPVGADLFKQGQTELGTQVIAGDVTFDDQLLVYSGTLSLANVNGAANQIVGLILMGRADASTVTSTTVPLATLLLDSSAGNHVTQNRLNDAEEVQFRSTGHFQMIGNATALTTENIGQLNVTESNSIDGRAVLTLVDGGAGVALTSDQFVRSAGSTLLVRGTGLGTAAAGAGVTNLIFDVTAPAITGTAGTPSVGVIAGMWGDLNTAGSGSSLVTYGANGVRLLNASEYASSFTGAGENVRLTSNQTLAGTLTDLTATLSGTGVTLNLGGRVLSLNGASIVSNGTAAGTITNGTLNFGSAAEGFIYLAQDLNLSASITGGAALTITGPGTLTINQPQSYTGQTSITQGNVVVNGSYILPASRLNVEGTLTFNGTNTYNRVGNLSGSILGTVALNGNTLEMTGIADTNFYGQITGSASSVLIKSGGNIFTQRSLNSAFVGSVVVRGGTFRLLGDTNTATSAAAGTLTGATSFLVETGGTLTLDNQNGTDSRAISNRIGDTASVLLNRGTFIITGSNNARPSEVIGSLVLDGGFSTLTLDSDYGSSTATSASQGDVVLTAGSLVRNNRATALVRGDNLGFAIGGLSDATTAANTTGGEAGDPGGAEANLIFTSAPVLSGTGTGAAIGIIPYLTGGMTASLNGTTAGGASLMTLGINGIRMLDISPTTTDYAYSAYTANTALSAASIAGNNVYLDINADNSDVLLGGSATIGGLVIDNAGGTGSDLLLQGNTLTIGGGIILSTGTQTNTITGGTGGQITFGPNAATGYEGRIHGARRIELFVPIVDNGANPVSITADGEVYYSAVNTYTGPTFINSGRIEISGGDNLMPIATVLTINGDGALRLFGGSQEVGGLMGIGFVENQSTTVLRTLTINTDSALDDFTFNGVFRNGASFALNVVKTGPGRQTFSGRTASTSTGSLTVGGGTLVLDGGITSDSGQTFLDNRFASTVPVVIGSGTASGVLQLGGAAGALNQTFSSLTTSGTGTANAVVGGNATFSTLTINQAANATFNGAIGGTGTFQNNLNLVKNGAWEQVIGGPATHAGTTTINAGKLFYDGFGGASVTTGKLTLADSTEFSLRGTSPTSSSVYQFSGTGEVVTVGTTLGATLGFALDGIYNTQINLAAGQTMRVNGTLTTAVYVNGTPVAGQNYVLINGADDGSIFGTGTFSVNPVVFNGGSFTYALSQVTAGAGEKWVLTPTAQPAAADVWWKGDITGLGQGVWSASLSSGTGFPTNWDTTETGGVDALVPPDSGSIVHFSAAGAANFTTVLGADLTIQELIFHAGTTPISIGSLGGVNTLTLGNTVDASGLTMLAGAPNVTISASVSLAQAQTWNIADAASTLTLTGALGGVGPFTLNGNGTALGTLVLGGANGVATYTGATTVSGGRLVLAGGANNRLPTTGSLTLGTATQGAVLQMGDAAGASNATIAELITSGLSTNAIVGGAAAASTLTVTQNNDTTYAGSIGGAGTNENNVGVVKQGSGTWTWSGVLTHTGGTGVREGILRLGPAASMTGTGPVSVVANAGKTATFDVNGKAISTTTVTLGGADSQATPTIADTAGGGSITLGGNLTYDATNNPLGAVLDVDLIVLNDPRSIIVGDSSNAAADLTINGTITVSGYTTDERLTFDGTGTIVLNDLVSLAGSGADLQKSGTGTLNINAATTAADDWLINEGIINVNVSNGLNAADDIVIDGTGVADSAIVNIGGTAGVSGFSQGDDLFIRNGGRVNVLVDNGISTGTDLILVGDTASVGAAAGRLHLAANMAATSMQVGASGGNVGDITGTGTITADGGYSLRGGTIASTITLAGAGGITKVGNGTLTFSGARASTGATAIQEGTLILDYTTNNASKIGGVLTLGVANAGSLVSTVQLTLNGNAAGTTQSVTSTTLERSGDVSIALNDGGAGITLALGAFTRTQLGGTLSLQYSGANATATSTSAAVSQLGWATVTLGGVTSFAEIDGTGKIVQATPTAQTNIAQWTPTANIVADANLTGTVPANSTMAIASLAFRGAVPTALGLDAGGVLRISSGGILVDSTVGANNILIGGGSLQSTATSPAGELIIHQNNTAGELVINSSIINSGGITKSGAGTLVLGGSNTFNATGTRLTINEGTVRVTGGNAIGDTTALVMRNGTTLDFNNSTETIGNIGLDTTNFSHGTLAVGTGSVTVNQTTSSSFFGGFTGSGSITKTGNGILSLEGNSTFSGTVTVNGGRWDLRGEGGFMASASTFILNRAELLSYQNSSTQRNRIGDGADIILNNTAGTQGLYMLTNQGNTKAENIGDIRIGAGHNVVSSHGNATGAVADLIADTLLRLDTAGQTRGTVLVRGNSLGASTGQRGLIRFDSGAQATIDGYEVGGGGTTGTSISIIPWMIGDLSQVGLGNSFVTNTGATDGLRPLASTEYLNDSTTLTSALTSNVRYTTGATISGALTSINSLVLDAASGITLTGPSSSLSITAGAILSAQGVSNIVDGFSGITTGGGRDYTVFVTDPAGVLTIASPLTSAVPLVKSGAGNLSLTSAANTFTDVYLNQGLVVVDNVNKLGSGALVFSGGGIRLDSTFTGDLASKTWNVSTGGGLLDVSQVTANAGVVTLNGLQDSTPNAGDVLTIQARGSSTSGMLLLQGTSTFIGTTVINQSGVDSSTLTSVLLNGTTNQVILGNLQIGPQGTVPDNSRDVVVGLGASEQIADTATISFNSTSGEETYFKLFGYTETVAGISSASRGVVENFENDTDLVAGDGKLILNSSQDFTFNGFMRNRSGTGAGGVLALEKQGTGVQTLSGSSISHTGLTTVSGGTLRLVSVTAWNSDILNNATLVLEDSAARTHAKNITGAGSLIKLGDGALTLSGADVGYTGTTTIRSGAVNVTVGTLATTGLRMDAGSTLRLVNGSGAALNLSSLDLGGGNLGPVTLGLELGSLSAFDRILSSGSATVTGAVAFELTGLSGLQAGDYDLLTALSGLSSGTYSIASITSAPGFTYALTTTDTYVRLTTTALTGDLYWRGAVSGSWGAFDSGLNSNFTTDLAGLVNAKGTPGAANRVIFSAAGATGPSIATTLDGNYTIAGLDFIASPSGVTTVTIASGTPTTSTLTINPSVPTQGISVAANAGAVTISARMALGSDQTWQVDGSGANGSSLAVSGVISGTGSLTKTGAGILTLSGTNTYTGTTTVSGGVLQLSGTQASAYTVGGAGTLRLNNANAAVPSLSGSGVVENGPTATAARTLTTGADNTSTTFSGVLQDGGSFALGLTKTGTGALTLSGASTHTGTTTVSNGILNISGSITGNPATSILAYGGSATRTTVNVSGDLTLFGLTGSNANGGVAVYNQTAGSVTITGNTSTANYVVGAAGSYGYFNLTGGTYKSLNRFGIAVSGSVAPQATSVMYIGGNGFLDLRGSEWTLNYSHGQVTVADSGVLDRSGARNPYGIIMDSSVAGGVYGVLNVAGGSFLTTTQPIVFGNSTTAGRGNGNVAFINLAAGILQAGTAMTVNLPSDGGNSAYLNFAGGTLRTSAAVTNWIPASSGAITFTSTLFGAVNNSAVAGAPSFTGGLVFDSNGFNSSLNAVLRGASGNGVTQADLTVVGGTGYIGAPEVIFSSAGVVAGGTPAAGYALIDNGAVVGIVITSPGTYTPGTVPTVTLVGGGGTGASVTAGALNTANNSGGLRKIGTGNLTLSGANTYTGGTIIDAGGIVLGAANVLADTGALTLNNGVFDVATFTDTVGVVTLNNGSINGTTGVLTSTSDYELRQGSVSAILAGSVGINKTTAGTVALSGASTFTGVVNVTGGTLAFSTSASLGGGGVGNTVAVNGATLSYTGAGSTNLGASRVITIGATGAVLDVTSSTGVLTVPGGISPASTGNLVKTGAGTLSLGGSVSLNGGAGTVTVSDGTLQAGFGTGGISALTVSASGAMSLQNSLAEILTLASTPGALTIASGGRLGLELGASGVSDRIVVGGAAAVAGTITLDLFNLGTLGAGTYTLLQAASGLDNASYVLGNAPSGFNYNITVSGTAVSLETSVLIARYWTGLQGGSWNTVNAGATNWSSTADGLTDAGAVPTAAHTVIFSGANVTSTAIATTLDAAFAVDSLQFLNVPANVASVTIAAGTGGTLSLAPASPSNGILVAANGGAVTISAPLTAASAQTWNVNGTGTSSLTLSGGVNFAAPVTKTGAGVLTLSGAGSGAGGLAVNGGTLNLNNAAALGSGPLSLGAGVTLNNSTGAAITVTTGNAQIWNGSFTFTGTQALNMGAGAVTLNASSTITTTASTLTVGGSIADDGNARSLTKAGAGTLVLSGGNTYDGQTTVAAGTLTLSGNNSGAAGGVRLDAGTLNINHAAALGSGVFTINGGTINNSTGAAIALSTSNLQNWINSFTFTGTQSLNLGSGLVTLGANITATVSANTLTVGALQDGANTFSLTKAGAGALAITGASSYKGSTSIQAGTVLLGVANALPTDTVLNLGSGSTAATLNLGAFSQTIGSLSVGNNTATANSIVIATGQTLTVSNGLVLSQNTDNAQNSLTMSGGGSLVVNGNVFTVGSNTTGSDNSSRSSLNLADLASVSINVTGTFGVQVAGDNDATHVSVLTLSNTANSITANTVTVGGSGTGGVQRMILGGGTNSFNTNNFNIGTGGRDGGSVTFAGSTGAFVLRNQAGTGRAAFNMGTGGANTGLVTTNVFDARAHNVDLLISTLAIGTQNRNGNLTNTFSFDTGIVDATTVIVGGNNGGTASTTVLNGVLTSNLDIGGGVFTIGTGGLDIANGNTAVTGTDVLNGTVNISGGTVTVANSTALAAAIRLGNSTQATGLTANGTLVITGGSLTVGGHIIKGSSTGAGTATLTLNGGTLDMSGRNIGGAAPATVVFNAQAGTLRNLAQLNNGSGLTKTTAGTLILDGTNTYTGGTTISEGVLQVGAGSSTGTLGAGAITNSGTLRFNRDNAYALAENISGTGSVVQQGTGTTTLTGTNTYTGGTTISAGVLQVGSGGAAGSLGTGAVVNSGTLSFNLSSAYVLNEMISGAGAVLQMGTGTTTLGGANTYTGKTTITAGKLSISSEANLGANPITGSADQLLLNGGSLQTTATIAIDDTNRGITVGTAGGGFEVATGTTTTVANVITGTGSLTKDGAGALLFTAVNTNTGTTTVNAGLLGGTGAVGGDLIVNSASSLAPGVGGAGEFTIGGRLTLNSGSILAAELGGMTLNAAAVVANEMAANGNLTGFVNNLPSSQWENYVSGSTAHDHLRINSTTTASIVNGTVKLTLIGGYTPAYGDVFDLVDWSFSGSLTGTPSYDFADITLPAGLGFNTDLFLSNGIIVVVPEPSRALFLLLGLLGLMLRRRRRW